MTKEYTFTLKYKLPASKTSTDELVDMLYTNGCDDALIGTGLPGQIALEFIREAKNADVAIQSAHQDVLKTLPQAQLIEAAPDYAGLTDIAEIVSVSRQQMRKIYEQADSFPTPLHTGKSVIWHLAEVLDWLKENKDYSFDEQTHEIARASAKLNFTSRNNKTIHTPNNYSKTAKLIVNISYPINALFSEKSITPSVVEAA